MTAFDRPSDPIKRAEAALEVGLSVEAAARTFGSAAHRACRIAGLRRVLAAHDPEAADRTIGRLLATLERERAA